MYKKMVKNETLRALRRHENRESGIYEEFVDGRLGPGQAFALLAGPLGDKRPLGWVLCPTLGPEHGNLRRLEAAVAWRLAAVGFPVVRIRPDARLTQPEIDVEQALAQAADAVELLYAQGVTSVALGGVLSGGLVAALAAEAHGAGALGILQPLARGRQYARELVRREAVALLMGSDERAPATPMDELKATGSTSIRGVRLTREAYEELQAVNLLENLRTFSGRSLLVDIATGGEVATGTRKLADHLAQLGGDVSVRMVEDPLYAPLGEYYYRDAGLLRIDTRLDLDLRIADVLSAWASEGSRPQAAIA